MNKFENEYRDLIQEEMPDLWDRIEAGLVEKQPISRIQSKTTTIYKFVKYAGVAVAACLLFVLVMPTAIGMLATGGSSEAAKYAQKDMAAAEEPAAEAPAAKASESNGTWAEDGALMEAAPMEEAIVEGAIKETYTVTESPVGIDVDRMETTAERKVLLEDGTIIEKIELCILEVGELNYHTVYIASVEADSSGTFQTGDVVEFIAMNDVANKAECSTESVTNEKTNNEAMTTDELVVGETFTVALIYDVDADIALRLVQ